MTIPVLPPYVAPYKPVPQVTPFTYRDGVTMLKRLELIIKYINRELVPFVNDNYSELADAFEEQVNLLITQFNAIVELIINDSIEVQDPVVATLINDIDSATRTALDAIYMQASELEADTTALLADSTSDVYAAIDPVEAHFITTTGSATRNALNSLFLLITNVDSVVAPIIGDEDSDSYAAIVDIIKHDHEVKGAVFNILDYGAVNNALTDNSAAINATIQACYSAGGGTVIIPPGNWGLASHIRARANVRITGYGATVHRRTAVQMLLQNFDTTDITTAGYNGDSNITVEGLTFDSHGDTIGDPINAADFNHAQNIRVVNCTFLRHPGYHALELNAVKNARVINCRFLGYVPVSGLTIKEAIQIDVAITGSIDSGLRDNTPCRDIIVEGCTFDAYQTLNAWDVAVGSHSVATDGTLYEDIKIVNNTIKTRNYGVHASYWRNTVIQGNSFDGNAVQIANSSGVQADNCDGLSVVGNTLNGEFGFAINITTACKNSVVSGNTVVDALIGIRDAAPSTVVSGNVCRNTSSYGISIDGGHDAIVTNNSIFGAGYSAGGLSAIRVTNATLKALISHNVVRPHGAGTEVPLGVSNDAGSSGIIVKDNDFSGIAADVSGSNVDNSILQASGNKFGSYTWANGADIWSTRVSITPSAANTVTSLAVVFPVGLFKNVPIAIVQPESSLPDTVTASVSAITAAGCTVYLKRPDTNVTSIGLLVMSRTTP